MNSILSELRKADDFEEATIFRAPLIIRESNRDMYEPSVVSIGPYYRGLPRFRAMEEKKWSFLQHFLDRKGCALQDCISKIKELEKQACCCYSEPFDMSSDDFVEMMVLDGCFILEYFHKYLETRDYKAIREGRNSSFIEEDMISLENHIPFFIIETLLGSSLNRVVLERIAHILTSMDIPIKAPSQPHKIHHLLHLCHCYAVHAPNAASKVQPNHRPFLNWISTVPILKRKVCDLEKRKVWQMPCATELEEAGVKFKKLEQSDDITKITFQSGTSLIAVYKFMLLSSLF